MYCATSFYLTPCLLICSHRGSTSTPSITLQKCLCVSCAQDSVRGRSGKSAVAPSFSLYLEYVRKHSRFLSAALYISLKRRRKDWVQGRREPAWPWRGRSRDSWKERYLSMKQFNFRSRCAVFLFHFPGLLLCYFWRHLQGCSVCFVDPVPGAAARGAGSSPAGLGGRIEEGGGQAAGCSQGEDRPRSQCYHTWEAKGRAQESQWVSQKQGLRQSFFIKFPINVDGNFFFSLNFPFA